MNQRMAIVRKMFIFLFAVLIASFVWLYVLEELGFGTWQCWP